jgi:gas vesicle protein
MKKVTSFLSGAVMGALVGVTLALLLTPVSGEELRGQMQTKAQQIQIEVKEAAEARRSDLEAQLANLRTPKKSEVIIE